MNADSSAFDKDRRMARAIELEDSEIRALVDYHSTEESECVDKRLYQDADYHNKRRIFFLDFFNPEPLK